MNHLCKIAGISIILFSSTSFAYQGNYYVSGDVGIFQADFNNTYLDQTDVIAQNITQPASQHGYTGGVALGYRQDYAKQYVLGAELSLNLDGQKALFQSGAATAAFSDGTQIDYHADLVFVPGIKLSASIISYLKLGLSLASLQDNLSSPVGYTAINTTYNSSKNCLGFAAGLGIVKSMTDKIAIFAEANYHDYGTVSFSSFQNFSATYTHKAHIYSYGVVMGISYQFA